MNTFHIVVSDKHNELLCQPILHLPIIVLPLALNMNANLDRIFVHVKRNKEKMLVAEFDVKTLFHVEQAMSCVASKQVVYQDNQSKWIIQADFKRDRDGETRNTTQLEWHLISWSINIVKEPQLLTHIRNMMIATMERKILYDEIKRVQDDIQFKTLDEQRVRLELMDVKAQLAQQRRVLLELSKQTFEKDQGHQNTIDVLAKSFESYK